MRNRVDCRYLWDPQEGVSAAGGKGVAAVPQHRVALVSFPEVGRFQSQAHELISSPAPRPRRCRRRGQVRQQGQGQQDDPQDNAQFEVTLVGLQGDGGGHDSGCSRRCCRPR